MNPGDDPWRILQSDFQTLVDWGVLALAATRLTFAAILGGLLGYQRGHAGKAAGLRTHMLVTLGTAVFVLIPAMHGMPQEGISRVIQGIAAGIGFLGGGVILRIQRPQEAHGLTTAAGIWLASGIGAAAGLGRLGLAVLATLLGLIVLGGLARFEHSLTPHVEHDVKLHD